MTAPTSSEPGMRWSTGRVLATLVIVAILGFWAWSFSPWVPRGNPDRLDGRAWVELAEAECAEAARQILDLPTARAAGSYAERADQIDAGSTVIADLVATLDRSRPDDMSDADRARTDLWIKDWAQYLDDRDRHVARLRDADPETAERDLAFVVSDIGTAGIYTERMDGFARVNDMDSCQVPGDV